MQAPLYAKYALSNDTKLKALFKQLESVESHHARIDGYCSFCKRDTTFNVDGIHLYSSEHWVEIAARRTFDQISLTCRRNDFHKYWYFLFVNRMSIQKVGQQPSIADIAIDETRSKYRTVLKGENWSELYKAIGLSAHGVGIASFVYLRRIFERLILARFDEHRAAEGWNEADFLSLRMDEKVEYLKGHLPKSMVEARKIYSIFSRGIHELSDDECLKFFEVGKRTIIMILEEELKAQQELAAKNDLAKAIGEFGVVKSEAKAQS